MKENSPYYRRRTRLHGTKSVFPNASPQEIVNLMEHPQFIESHKILNVGKKRVDPREFHEAARQAHEITKELIAEGWTTDVIGAADLVRIGYLRKPSV